MALRLIVGWGVGSLKSGSQKRLVALTLSTWFKGKAELYLQHYLAMNRSSHFKLG